MIFPSLRECIICNEVDCVQTIMNDERNLFDFYTTRIFISVLVSVADTIESNVQKGMSLRDLLICNVIRSFRCPVVNKCAFSYSFLPVLLPHSIFSTPMVLLADCSYGCGQGSR